MTGYCQRLVLGMLDAGRSWDEVARRLGTTVAEAKALAEPARIARRQHAAQAKTGTPAAASTEVFAGIEKTLYNAGPGSLAKSFPQVSSRARLYRLEDDGASELARRKRWAKGRDNSIEQHRRAVAAIAERQTGRTPRQPLPAHVAEAWIAGHLKAIRAILADADATRPQVNVIAPITRRVAREDRRRKAAEKKRKNRDSRN